MGGKRSLFKVAILGIPKSGATRVFSRLTGQEFFEEDAKVGEQTEGVSVKKGPVKKKIQQVESDRKESESEVEYYDFNGEQRFNNSIHRTYLKKANLVLFCMTPTQLRAFSSLEHTNSGIMHLARIEKEFVDKNVTKDKITQSDGEKQKAQIDTQAESEKNAIEEQAKELKEKIEQLLENLSKVDGSIKLMFVITKKDIAEEVDILWGGDALKGFHALKTEISNKGKLQLQSEEYILVSAKNKEGIDDLQSTIAEVVQDTDEKTSSQHEFPRPNQSVIAEVVQDADEKTSSQHESSHRGQIEWKVVGGGVVSLIASGGLLWATLSGTSISVSIIATGVTVFTATSAGLAALLGVALLLGALYLSYEQKDCEPVEVPDKAALYKC